MNETLINYTSNLGPTIPSANVESHSVRFPGASRYISQFGDGLSSAKLISAKAAAAQSGAYEIAQWCDHLNKRGERAIRATLVSREKQIRQWQRNLKREIDNLAREHEYTEKCLRFLQKILQYFRKVLRTSQVTLSYRQKIENLSPGDDLNKYIEEEISDICSAADNVRGMMDKIKLCLSKLEDARNCLLSDAEAKGMNLTITKSCQHSEPLLSYPYIPGDKVHPYHPENEEQWEADVNGRIQASWSVRSEASDCCCIARHAADTEKSKVAVAWGKTNDMLKEEIQRDENALSNLKKHLNTTVKDINFAHERAAIFHNDLATHEKLKKLEFWRLQRLNYRPEREHIKDRPAKSLESEVVNIENRMDDLTKCVKNDQELVSDLYRLKNDLTRSMDRMSKKVFIDRENCLGLRKTILIEGSNEKNY